MLSNVTVRKIQTPNHITKKIPQNNLVYADNIISFAGGGGGGVSNGVIFELIHSYLLSSSLVVVELLSFLSIGSYPAGLILLILYYSMQEKYLLKI